MKRRGIRESKKAAFELSVTTIIIIVIGVVFLILGLTLVRNIFFGAEKSIGAIEQLTMSEIQKMFPESSESFSISLTDGVATLYPGTEDFGFLIKSSTKYGDEVGGRDKLTFVLELDKEKDGNCVDKLGESRVSRWFVDQEVSTATNMVYNNMPKYEGSIAAARIAITIPSETTPCDQVVYITFVDKTVTQTDDQVIGGSSFKINVKKRSVFG